MQKRKAWKANPNMITVVNSLEVRVITSYFILVLLKKEGNFPKFSTKYIEPVYNLKKIC